MGINDRYEVSDDGDDEELREELQLVLPSKAYKRKCLGQNVMQIDDSDYDDNGEDDDDVFGFNPDDVSSKHDVADEEAEFGSAVWKTSKKSYFYGGKSDKKRQEELLIDGLNEDEFEAVESRQIRASELQDMDMSHFGLADIFCDTAMAPGEEIDKSLPVTSFADMSVAEKTRHFDSHAPEFVPLVADLRHRMVEFRNVISPLAEVAQDIDSKVIDLVELKRIAYLGYMTTVSTYIMFKAQGEDVTGHPIAKQIAKYKKAIIDPLDEQCAKHGVHRLVARLIKLNKGNKDLSKLAPKLVVKYLQRWQAKLTTKQPSSVPTTNNDTPVSSHEDAHVESVEVTDKRTITYEMQKNKGLQPKRSRIQRNPRTRYRARFDKAVKRRKGQVAPMRDQSERARYTGEHSGINVRVRKGVKLQ